MLNRLFILLVFVLPCVSAFSQVKLHGEVTHDGKTLDRVTIQVYEKGKLQRTIAATKKGVYETEFPIDHTYLLVFRRPYMIPVRIVVNTSLAEEGEGEGFDVPLNMEMYYRFEALDVGAYNEPIGEVRSSGSGENTFSFHPDKARLEQVKLVNEHSLGLEREGAKPVDNPEKTAEEAVQEKHDLSNQAGGNEGAGDGKPGDESVVATHEMETKLRLEREISRYDQIEKAQMESSAQDRELEMKSQTVKTNRDDEREGFITESKVVHSETHITREAQQEKTANARVAKQERMAGELEEAARKKSTSFRSGAEESSYGISIKKGSGWFYIEEILNVSECGVRNQYRHTVYDWLLFDVEYYYMNDSEISKEMYDSAKELFK